MKQYLHDLKYGLLCMLIVLACVFTCVHEIRPSDDVFNNHAAQIRAVESLRDSRGGFGSAAF